MDSWRLPTSLSVGGVDRPIRTDFRCILDILRMLDDRDLPSWAQTVCLIKMLFIDWKTIPQEQYTEACEKAMSFIDNGIEPEDKDYKKKRPRLMDWDQDAEMIVSAIPFGTSAYLEGSMVYWPRPCVLERMSVA